MTNPRTQTLRRSPWWVLTRGAAAFVIFALSFYGTLSIMDRIAPPCPSGRSYSLAGPFSHRDGFSYIAALAALDQMADSIDDPKRSNVVLCEGGNRLGPAHTRHADIAQKGVGRFSHWTSLGVVFSTSDNTDPNTNRRRYSIVDTARGEDQ
jgi:hypothetical protein